MTEIDLPDAPVTPPPTLLPVTTTTVLRPASVAGLGKKSLAGLAAWAKTKGGAKPPCVATLLAAAFAPLDSFLSYEMLVRATGALPAGHQQVWPHTVIRKLNGIFQTRQGTVVVKTLREWCPAWFM
jgi:hypothetical protein